MAVSAIVVITLLMLERTPLWEIADHILLTRNVGPASKWDETAYQGYYSGWVQGGGSALAGLFAVLGGYLAFRGAVRQSNANLKAVELQIGATKEAADEQRLLRARAVAGIYHLEMERALDYLDVADLLVAEFEKPPPDPSLPAEEQEFVLLWVEERPKFLTISLDEILSLGVPIVRQRERLVRRFESMAFSYEECSKKTDMPDHQDLDISRAEIANNLRRVIDELKAEMRTTVDLLHKALAAATTDELDSLPLA